MGLLVIRTLREVQSSYFNGLFLLKSTDSDGKHISVSFLADCVPSKQALAAIVPPSAQQKD